MCGRQPSPEGGLVDVVGEHLLAVDLDDRDQLAIRRLELRIAVDRDLAELEPQLVSPAAHLGERPLAEMAPGGVKDRNSDGLRYVIQDSVGDQG